jgi:radical SAM superfamily enzyme YgiQ (UPF0313 family)
MIKRILLIDIEKNWEEHSKGSFFPRWGHHPIGLMYLASAVQKSCPDITIRIFHTITSSHPLDSIRSLILDFDPDLVGLRALSLAQDIFRTVVERIRELIPDVKLVAGGPYPSSSFEDIVSSMPVDVVVIGEGEKTFTELINKISTNGEIPSGLPGTAVLVNNHVKVNKPQSPIADLNTIPSPDYDLINLKDYDKISNQAFRKTSESAFIFSSRGCPFKCFYCHQMFGKKVRHRTPRNVVEEMRQHLEKRGIRNFVFLDDLFNVPMKIAKETLSLIAKELPDIQINFSNGLRADQIDDEFIDLFEKAGTVQMALAVETASPRLQKIMGKNLDLAKTEKAIEAVSKRFILCTYFMVGFPTETYEEAMETICFAERLEHIVQPALNVVRIYKGTTLFEMLQPNKEQTLSLINQEQNVYTPNLFDDPTFYGDLFPDEKVPLSGEDIQTLKWEWARRVVNNKNRINNCYRILQKHLSHQQIIEFYRGHYQNPNFNQKSLERLLKHYERIDQ